MKSKLSTLIELKLVVCINPIEFKRMNGEGTATSEYSCPEKVC